MSNEVLSILLKEYEQKRRRAELDLEKRKEDLYNKIPRLAEIESELSKHAISTAKEMLKNNKNGVKELNIYVEKLKKEKESILKSKKLDSSYLKPKYECKDCNDTGYITNQDYTTTMCHCLRQKMLDRSYNKANISNLDKENFEKFNINVFLDVKDKNHNISPRKNMEYIQKKCIEFVENFDNPDTKNLLFTGNIGLRENIYV